MLKLIRTAVHEWKKGDETVILIKTLEHGNDLGSSIVISNEQGESPSICSEEHAREVIRSIHAAGRALGWEI